ncbi:MAG: nucleotidyl transferase AbiEii/AbiGii toxin family protein [Desulfovermiculus sp.]
MIPQRNISLLSNRLARTGQRRIPEKVLELDYCLAWFLIGLSKTSLQEYLIFKGGTALKRCYFPEYRFSEDLDFSLFQDISLENILSSLEDVYLQVKKESGIVFGFGGQDRSRHQNCHTFYLTYDGPLPGSSPKKVKVDITVQEKFVFPVNNQAVLRGYDEYEDIIEDGVIKVYSLNEICVEKFLALTDPARNEPRDLYDFWYLVSCKHVDMAMLWPEVMSKLEFRGRSHATLIEAFDKKEARYRKLWEKRLGAQMTSLPSFDEVFRLARRAIKRAGLSGSGLRRVKG